MVFLNTKYLNNITHFFFSFIRVIKVVTLKTKYITSVHFIYWLGGDYHYLLNPHESSKTALYCFCC